MILLELKENRLKPIRKFCVTVLAVLLCLPALMPYHAVADNTPVQAGADAIDPPQSRLSQEIRIGSEDEGSLRRWVADNKWWIAIGVTCVVVTAVILSRGHSGSTDTPPPAETGDDVGRISVEW
jgi:hypothetical protein